MVENPLDGEPSKPPSPQSGGGSLLDSAVRQGNLGGETPEPQPTQAPENQQPPRDPGSDGRWVSLLGWVLALSLVALAIYTWQDQPDEAQAQIPQPTRTPIPVALELEPTPVQDVGPIALPQFEPENPGTSILRRVELTTIIPTRARTEVLTHTVTLGDSIFALASAFNITPETVLWANYELLNDNPDLLSTGMELFIPPLDGVYYQWQAGDTLESVAESFETSLDSILNFTGNQIDLLNPDLKPGDYVMIPDGKREFRQWLFPTINPGNAGVNSAALGPGACTGSYAGPSGSGAFIWPTGRHFLSGNDYWSGHLAIDLAAVEGDPIVASDAGVIVFAGWANGGYGNTVVVDHGNGYQSLYAHMSSVGIGCGATVAAGRYLGGAGSTGNSTGTHLHFEIRLYGGFINPWFVLPPP